MSVNEIHLSQRYSTSQSTKYYVASAQISLNQDLWFSAYYFQVCSFLHQWNRQLVNLIFIWDVELVIYLHVIYRGNIRIHGKWWWIMLNEFAEHFSTLQVAEIDYEYGDVIYRSTLIRLHSKTFGAKMWFMQSLTNVKSSFFIGESIPQSIGCKDKEARLMKSKFVKIERKYIRLGNQ